MIYIEMSYNESFTNFQVNDSALMSGYGEPVRYRCDYIISLLAAESTKVCLNASVG